MKQRFIRIASSVAAVLLLAVGLIWLCHADPIEAFGYFCYGLFGSLNGFAEIFVKATPLILMGLGVSISFQTGFFNIGAEGQFYMGALMATFVAIKLPGPPWFRCILAIFVAFIFGGDFRRPRKETYPRWSFYNKTPERRPEDMKNRLQYPY